MGSQTRNVGRFPANSAPRSRSRFQSRTVTKYPRSNAPRSQSACPSRSPPRWPRRSVMDMEEVQGVTEVAELLEGLVRLVDTMVKTSEVSQDLAFEEDREDSECYL